MKKINVLSLFDGMSCGQIALKEQGIIVGKYYASEIDKHAIGQTQLNFPNTIQIGSVVDLDVSKLDYIDLIIGGSPCQSFSFAGKRNGMSTIDNVEIYTLNHYLQLKNNGFEFQGQSYLFWEYMRILEDIRKYNPSIKFLLENVEMGKKWERVLSEAIGIMGIHINSSLVSAQNRKRIYWSNIRTKKEGLFKYLYTDIPQPKDRGILLCDMLEDRVNEKYFLSEKMINYLKNNKLNLNIKNNKNKASCFTAGGNSGGLHRQMDLIIHNLMPRSSKTGKGGSGHLSKTDDKSYCLDTGQTTAIEYKNNRIRRLTPSECARLQTIPSWYKWNCSDTQQYKMLGNGWTIEVIKHIFSYLNI